MSESMCERNSRQEYSRVLPNEMGKGDTRTRLERYVRKRCEKDARKHRCCLWKYIIMLYCHTQDSNFVFPWTTSDRCCLWKYKTDVVCGNTTLLHTLLVYGNTTEMNERVIMYLEIQYYILCMAIQHCVLCMEIDVVYGNTDVVYGNTLLHLVYGNTTLCVVYGNTNCNKLQHTATHHNTLQHCVYTRCNKYM